MDTNKILTADMLDLLFDDRNKEYGAYELRRTYQKRITRALLITAGISLLLFTGVVLANALKNNERDKFVTKEVTLADFKPAEKPPEQLPEKKPESPVRSVIFTPPVIVEVVDEPPPTQEEMDSARIDVVKQEGDPDKQVPGPQNIDGNKGIIDPPTNTESNEPVTIVEVQAKFAGDWEKFLRKNLNPEVPVNNGAPSGNHTIIIQFVVDKEGNVSDIQPLTNLGYGMEQEAIRVLKKATKWDPAIQNGYPVKAYRRQPITFQVLEDE